MVCIDMELLFDLDDFFRAVSHALRGIGHGLFVDTVTVTSSLNECTAEVFSSDTTQQHFSDFEERIRRNSDKVDNTENVRITVVWAFWE